MSDLLKDWSADHTAKFQKEIITFQHGLPKTELFSRKLQREIEQ